MNVGHLSFVASIAATSLAQSRASDIERTQQDTTAHELKVESAAEAEAAEGIGETHEEQAAGDRDADGRRPWEFGDEPRAAKIAEEEELTSQDGPHSKDPTGQTGLQIDLCG